VQQQPTQPPPPTTTIGQTHGFQSTTKAREEPLSTEENRRLPWGGGNAVDPVAASTMTRVGSSIANRLSTTFCNNSTTDDTLKSFNQVTPTHLAHQSITVSPEHVIKYLRRPRTPHPILFPKYYPHNIHPRFRRHGTMWVINLIRFSLSTRQTKLLINIQLDTTLGFSQHEKEGH